MRWFNTYHLQVRWPLYKSSRFCPDLFLPNFLFVGLLTRSCLLLRHCTTSDSRVELFRDLILQFPFIRRSLFYGILMADVGEDIWHKKCRILKRKCDELEQTNSVLYGKFLKIQKVIEDAEQEKRYVLYIH